MQAVEAALPLYESVSEAVSFGLAGPLRRKAVAWLTKSRGSWTLDLGTGPGVSSRLLFSYGFERVVGLDPSPRLLSFARTRTGPSFHPVVGVSENLPFKAGTFTAILTCFALRDVKDLVRSLMEVSRVAKHGGGFAVVDVGKPDGMFLRDVVSLYVKFGMPLLARLLIRRRIVGNPFRMIIPTFQRLVTNHSLRGLIQSEFGSTNLREYMRGGLVVIEATKPQSKAPDPYESNPGLLQSGTNVRMTF